MIFLQPLAKTIAKILSLDAVAACHEQSRIFRKCPVGCGQTIAYEHLYRQAALSDRTFHKFDGLNEPTDRNVKPRYFFKLRARFSFYCQFSYLSCCRFT